MLTQRDRGAVVSSLQWVARQMCYLAPEKLIFVIFLVIHFILDSHAFHHDTLRYLRLFRSMSYEEKENALASAERLFEILFF